MRIPLNWLKEYVDLPSDTEELTKKLTAIGHMQDKKPEQVGDDVVIDLEVRQNRPDCLSILGVAREVAAVTGKMVKAPNIELKAQSGQTKEKLYIENTAPDLCHRFNAYRIKFRKKNSEISTPQWMIDRLTAYGIKVISPLVDITNYVTIELGEPLHAFDIRHIEANQIVIRKATDAEQITILGGKMLKLTTDDLVIASKSKALSLAGIIGGEESGVQPDTTEIILEAATYNQASIRRSSIRHSVRTEASTRHEKFLHPHLAEVALQRAASLLVELYGGEIVSHADSYPSPVEKTSVTLHLSEIERLGGISISSKQVDEYLQSLGFSIDKVSNGEFRVSVPYWRTDVEQEADLVEEVLRLYGYENIPQSLPPVPPPNNITSYWFRLEEQIRDSMLQLGFDEQITEPLTKKSTEQTQIQLQNALNADKNALRTDLKDGLMHALHHQKKFERTSIQLFELGRVYGKTTHAKKPYIELRQLGFLMYDATAQKDALYLTAKGIVETVSKKLGYPFSDEIFSLQLLDEKTVFGAIEIEKYWSPKAKKVSADRQLYVGIPNFQRFDISLYLDVSVKVGDVIGSIQKSHAELESIDYEISPSNKDGKQNVLLKFTATSGAKNTLMRKISDMLQGEYGAEIR